MAVFEVSEDVVFEKVGKRFFRALGLRAFGLRVIELVFGFGIESAFVICMAYRGLDSRPHEWGTATWLHSGKKAT